MDKPVVGRFNGNFNGSVGTFLAQDTLDGKPIEVRFIWKAHPDSNPTWEQAFSPDGGITWETNWTMVFERSVG